jgi:hypothetical protein
MGSYYSRNRFEEVALVGGVVLVLGIKRELHGY